MALSEDSSEATVVSQLENGNHVVSRETFKREAPVCWFWEEVGERRGYGRTPFDVQALARRFPSKGNGPFVREIQAALKAFTDQDPKLYSKNFLREIEAYQSRQ